MCVTFLTGPRLMRCMTADVLTCDAQTLNCVQLNVEGKRRVEALEGYVGAIGNLLGRVGANGI